MPRRCERPGCSASAAVAYGFEAERSHVWLEAVTEDAAATVNAGVLCRRHADALRPPRGWFLDDRRELTPRLFRPPTHSVPSTKRRRPRRPAGNGGRSRSTRRRSCRSGRSSTCPTRTRPKRSRGRRCSIRPTISGACSPPAARCSHGPSGTEHRTSRADAQSQRSATSSASFAARRSSRSMWLFVRSVSRSMRATTLSWPAASAWAPLASGSGAPATG